MKILPDATLKRSLCFDIAQAYRENAEDLAYNAKRESIEYRNGPFPHHLSILFDKVSEVLDKFREHELEEESIKYESLGSSKIRIYLKREKTLIETLDKLRAP